MSPDRKPTVTVRLPRTPATLFLAALLGGCASVGVGFGIPVGPVTIGVGASNGGVSLGVGAGVGPVGVGVGVDQGGRVNAGVGVGASTEIGNSGVRAGVGVGTGTTIYDPNKPNR